MKTACLNFKNTIAYSQTFDDIYFNTDNPKNESEYVFVSAIDELWEKQDKFIIAEAGFGAGLNFLTLCERFKNSKKRLHFVSIEGYPISPSELMQIYKNLNIFKQESKKLANIFPPRINGIHRINYSENITLDLCFGEISDMIKELDFEADIWFMDGFAPKKNSGMWSEDIFRQIARLTRTNGVVRTYSSAKIVQENFKKAGFCLELKKGYGKKRQMSHAILKSEDKNDLKGYFARYEPKNPIKTALIIGAGIAGIATASELKSLGIDVTIAEKRKSVAMNGSSNHCGILIPLITKPHVKLGKMHINAFLLATRFYKESLSKRYVEFNGAYEYAFNDELYKRYFLNANENSEIFKFLDDFKPYPAVFIKDGASVRPAKSCKKLSKFFNIKTNLCYKSHKHLKNGKISVKFSNNTIIKTDILVFATGSESVEIFKNLPISFVRGQVTHIKPLLDTKVPHSAQGYITQEVDGIQVVGASYSRNEKFDNSREIDNNENLQKIAEFIKIKNANIIGSNVGYRSYSSDRFPIIGALHDEEFYKDTYNNLFWSKHKGISKSAKYKTNIFVNIAHGSRGLSTAVLGAKIIGDLVASRPLCIEKSLFDELHSARFLIRKLKRGIKN